MAQNQTGSIGITTGLNRVIGTAGVDWSTIPDPTLNPVQFSIVGSALVYQVGSVTPPNLSVSTFWELTVIGVIQDGTAAGLEYALHFWFSKKGLPLFSVGDVQTAALLTRAFMAMDATSTDTTDDNLVRDSLVVAAQAGATEFFVPFTAGPLPFTPLHIFNPTFVKVASGDDNVSVVSTDTWGLGGFNVNLSAPAIAGQTLMFSYIKAPAANANVVVGTILIAGGLIGATVVPVVIAPPLAAPPAHVDTPIFEKVNPTDDNVFAASIDGIADAGYNVNLSAPAIAGQILHYSYQKV